MRTRLLFRCGLRTLRALLLLSTLIPASEALAAGAVKAGVGAVDITPDWREKPVWIAGFGMGRRAKDMRDPLYARALVLTDGQKKIGMVCLDIVGLLHHRVEIGRASCRERV